MKHSIDKEKNQKTTYNREADKRWAEKNREHKNYLSRRSNSRGFIRTMATNEDLAELEILIKNRRKELQMEKPT